MKNYLTALVLVLAGLIAVSAQNKNESIGGAEHELNIYGVQVGMDVPTALQNVFVNAHRRPGEEKPDGKRAEGKDNKDIRIVYKNLPEGEMQILFAQGKIVKEVTLKYAMVKRVSDLRLPNSSGIGEASSGERFDDRYTIGFVDNKKQEKLWWRDEKRGGSYHTRLTFRSGNSTKDTTMWWQTVVQKTLTVQPDEQDKFLQSIK